MNESIFEGTGAKLKTEENGLKWFVTGYGYYFAEDTTAKGLDRVAVIRPINRDSYTPEIYRICPFASERKMGIKPELKIQTTAYGTKTVDEIDAVIAGYMRAQNMIQYIKQILGACGEWDGE